MASDLIHYLHTLFLPAVASLRAENWQPPADIYRTREGWLVKFDLAGVRPEDIEITIHGRTLSVRGTRRDTCIAEECQHYSMEISYSQFERSLMLPVELGRVRLSTEWRQGMLLVRIHKEAP